MVTFSTSYGAARGVGCVRTCKVGQAQQLCLETWHLRHVLSHFNLKRNLLAKIRKYLVVHHGTPEKRLTHEPPRMILEANYQTACLRYRFGKKELLFNKRICRTTCLYANTGLNGPRPVTALLALILVASGPDFPHEVLQQHSLQVPLNPPSPLSFPISLLQAQVPVKCPFALSSPKKLPFGPSSP